MENWKVQLTAKATLPGNVEKPTYAEMVRFLFGTMEMQYEEIKCMYLSVSGKEIFFRCYNEQTVKKIIDDYDGALFKFENGTVAKVIMSLESECLKYVRVWGIPPDAPDGDVARFFGNYGDVKRVVRERYPRELNCPVETGVRGIHMDLRQELPHFMYIRNFRIKVHYEGQKERCFGCGSTEHIRADCPKRTLTPASRVEAVSNFNNHNQNERCSSEFIDPIAPKPVLPETSAESVPTFANVLASTENIEPLFHSEPVPAKTPADNIADTETQAKPTLTKMLPPVTRQSRSRAETRVSKDRCSRSSSSSSPVGRPKKKKNLVIETIAKGPLADKSTNGAFAKKKNIGPTADLIMDDTTEEGILDVIMTNFGDNPY